MKAVRKLHYTLREQECGRRVTSQYYKPNAAIMVFGFPTGPWTLFCNPLAEVTLCQLLRNYWIL